MCCLFSFCQSSPLHHLGALRGAGRGCALCVSKSRRGVFFDVVVVSLSLRLASPITRRGPAKKIQRGGASSKATGAQRLLCFLPLLVRGAVQTYTTFPPRTANHGKSDEVALPLRRLADLSVPTPMRVRARHAHCARATTCKEPQRKRKLFFLSLFQLVSPLLLQHTPVRATSICIMCEPHTQYTHHLLHHPTPFLFSQHPCFPPIQQRLWFSRSVSLSPPPSDARESAEKQQEHKQDAHYRKQWQAIAAKHARERERERVSERDTSLSTQHFPPLALVHSFGGGRPGRGRRASRASPPPCRPLATHLSIDFFGAVMMKSSAARASLANAAAKWFLMPSGLRAAAALQHTHTHNTRIPT